ncbi:hypothetical protein [Flavivirga sp. 57AJ16]|uniref:hypothetical protein n=1 Tax=Flavivirga sp. 57AJ16 TaxID=3025307 RepID=UPI0023668281|nr:hypothetical protein [Flavivirga sp. 57AJ16]MDD7885754.1 hypothetical protein [Flavivirga sp. 57AJ16]
MDYTLDSVTQVVKAFEEFNPSKKVSKVTSFIEDLNDILPKENRFYFGVLTVSENVVKAVLKNGLDNDIITITKNSQIVELFHSVEFLDAMDAELAQPYGQFRGFEIYIR